MYSAGILQKLLLISQGLALIWHYQRTQSEIRLTRPDIKEISAPFLFDQALWMSFYWHFFRQMWASISFKGIQQIFQLLAIQLCELWGGILFIIVMWSTVNKSCASNYLLGKIATIIKKNILHFQKNNISIK